ncbi:MAG: hypothetical protein K8T90_14330 [Planctomycetes bacterium]|nr:hypothetical protein [Planctomycetota bacterium]
MDAQERDGARLSRRRTSESGRHDPGCLLLICGVSGWAGTTATLAPKIGFWRATLFGLVGAVVVLAVFFLLVAVPFWLADRTKRGDADRDPPA